MKRLLLAFLLQLGVALHASAETADKEKPLNYEANSGECDDLKQVCVLSGDVILVKGTMRATAEKVQIRKDPEGYQHGVLVAAPGKLVSFRQRRDPTKPGIEEYVEGFAERVEYDEKTETVRLITRARVRLLENDIQRDELRGDSITYDQRNSKYFVTGGKPSTESGSTDGRVRGTIAPRAPATPESGTPAPLKPAAQISKPRTE